MKINRLEHTKKLYPHFYDKTDESNFTKHLKIVGNQQQDIRHKLKSVEWSRILEKPLQLWKEQTQPYIYDMHFKVIVPYLKQVNIYKNPIIDDNEEVIGYEELSYTENFEYEDRTILFEKVLDNLESTSMIPRTNYLLEIYTWDDYHFLKGYPENDYTVKEDNVLTYRYNESFLSISIEEISYTKYLTFRVHKDKIKHIQIYKNDEPFFKQVFDYDLIKRGITKGFSYTYFDDDVTNEPTYLENDGSPYHYEIEDDNTNNIRKYFVGSKDEYVYRLLLTDSDFEDGVLKDIYDLEVRTFEKRYHCRQDYDKVYSKRYAGYDEQLNDCFDHDYSLDMIGRLLNIPRFRFYQVYEEDEAHYSRTYPTYYNRATEDDYNYMKRIQFYISNYNHIVFPVLEFWKYYHTMATIRSRKRILGEMDYAYFRTSQTDDYICSDEIEWLEEEFDSETITEYSINKATLTKGDSQYVSLGDGWYETTIVNNVYVVPDVDYRLRYGVKDNEENVTIRLICYNRQGIELRTTPVIPISTNDLAVEYSTDTEYTYTDTLITIPSDTTSIKLILESNNSFKFTDVTFERKTVIDFDNMYMTTEEDYNSNVYELSTIYEDLPTNLRIGGDRFDRLFKRSLPLTKKGYFLIDVNEKQNNEINLDTSISLYLTNFLEEDQRSATINNLSDYSEKVEQYIREDNDYNLSFILKSEEITTVYDEDNEFLPILDDDYFITTSISFYDVEDNLIEVKEMDEKVYSNIESHLSFNFTTPLNTSYINIRITSQINAELTEISLSRVEEMSDEEVYGIAD